MAERHRRHPESGRAIVEGGGPRAEVDAAVLVADAGVELAASLQRPQHHQPAARPRCPPPARRRRRPARSAAARCRRSAASRRSSAPRPVVARRVERVVGVGHEVRHAPQPVDHLVERRGPPHRRHGAGHLLRDGTVEVAAVAVAVVALRPSLGKGRQHALAEHVGAALELPREVGRRQPRRGARDGHLRRRPPRGERCGCRQGDRQRSGSKGHRARRPPARLTPRSRTIVTIVTASGTGRLTPLRRAARSSRPPAPRRRSPGPGRRAARARRPTGSRTSSSS